MPPVRRPQLPDAAAAMVSGSVSSTRVTWMPHSVAAHSWSTPSMFALSFDPHGVPEGAT